MTTKERFESTTALLMLCSQLAQSGVMTTEEAMAEAKSIYSELKRILEIETTNTTTTES